MSWSSYSSSCGHSTAAFDEAKALVFVRDPGVNRADLDGIETYELHYGNIGGPDGSIPIRASGVAVAK